MVVFHLLKLAYRREQAFGREDLLTGLPNSRAFAETADRELRRAHRTGDPVSLLYLDCDDFKAVNDRFGHSAGDALLRAGDALMYEAKAAGKANIRTAVCPDWRAEPRNPKL